MSQRHRGFVLPVLAVLVPCALIALLAWQWLAVEREAARLRGTEAASGDLHSLQRDLRAAIASAAIEVAAASKSGALDVEARPSALVADAFFIDARPPAQNHSSDALRARAASLLTAGRDALVDGRPEDAERLTIELVACCGALRDEFDVSYTIYAASQRLAINSRRPDRARVPDIVRDLRSAIERGYLIKPTDVTGLRLLVEKLGDEPGVPMLVPSLEQRVATAARRLRLANQMESWTRSLVWDAEDARAVRIGTWRAGNSATLAAAGRSATGALVGVILDRNAIAQWVVSWSTVHSSFAFAVLPPDAATDVADAALTGPLFVEAPEIVVAAHRTANDSATDQQRQALFVAVTGASLALTLFAGYVAARDTFRERRTAVLRSTFLAGVTHEIKTPLTSIRLMAETLQQHRASPGESEELLGMIVGEAEHLSGLVDNVLGTARVESGTRTYNKRRISLSAAVRAACRRVEYASTKEGFTLRESIPPDSIDVLADPDALGQVVLNLLSNAMKYSGASREIGLAVSANGQRAAIQVTDSGIGVPPKEQKRIFTSFYRASSAEPGPAGTGLGLALVKHFADAHGGTIDVDSFPGRGSTFTMTLPISAPALSGGDHG